MYYHWPILYGEEPITKKISELFKVVKIMKFIGSASSRLEQFCSESKALEDTVLENSIDIKQYLRKRRGEVASPWQHLSLKMAWGSIVLQYYQ